MEVRHINGRKRGLKYNSVGLYLTPKELRSLLRWYKEGKSCGIGEPPPQDRVTVYSVGVMKEQ